MMMHKIRLMIVDDHEVVRLGMRAAFELEADIAVVGEASNGAEALAKVPVFAPNILLMDVFPRRRSSDSIATRWGQRIPGEKRESHRTIEGGAPGSRWTISVTIGSNTESNGTDTYPDTRQIKRTSYTR